MQMKKAKHLRKKQLLKKIEESIGSYYFQYFGRYSLSQDFRGRRKEEWK